MLSVNLVCVQWAGAIIGVRDRPVVRLKILDSVNGVLKPGRLALLLGPPSSGKSTLLKALSGRLDHSGLQVSV